MFRLIDRIARLIVFQVIEVFVVGIILYGLYHLTLYFGWLANPYFAPHVCGTFDLFAKGVLIWCGLGVATLGGMVAYFGIRKWIKWNWRLTE